MGAMKNLNIKRMLGPPPDTLFVRHFESARFTGPRPGDRKRAAKKAAREAQKVLPVMDPEEANKELQQ